MLYEDDFHPVEADILNTSAEHDSLKADVPKVLWLLMLRFSEVVVLIWKTTKVYAARCEVCTEDGPSLALPSSVSHEIVLSAATYARLSNVPELSLVTLLSFHCLKPGTFEGATCKLLLDPFQHGTKKSLALSTSAEWQVTPPSTATHAL